MTRLTAQFTMEASADLDARTITGTLTPYGEIGQTSIGPVEIVKGALTVPDKVVLLVAHDADRPIGLLAEYSDQPRRLYGSFKVAGTSRGDEALLEAAEGIRSGLSVGVDIDEHTTDPDTGVVTVTAGTLREVSLVTFPAFTSATVDKVAASEPEPEAEPEAPDAEPAEEPNTEPEEQTVDQSTTVAEAAAPADLPRIHVQDPFPYRPGVQASFFADMVKSSRDHDVEAARRFNQAQMMMTAAADTTTNITEIIPTIYRPDLFMGLLTSPRIVVESFSRGPLDGPNPQRIPKMSTATGLVDDHVEGTNPTTGNIETTEQILTPKAVSGTYTATREMIEGSNPAVDQIIMGLIRDEYAADSEAYAITTLLAGATAGTVVDISDGATMQVRQRFITFQANRKRAASVFLAGSDLFGALATQVDGAGRPMNPSYGPANAAGGVGVAVETIEVAGRVTPYVYGLTGGILGVQSDFITLESGLRMWRWEEKGGPANIDFSCFGYQLCAVIRAAGLLKFATQA